jgi:hypothetical protein
LEIKVIAPRLASVPARIDVYLAGAAATAATAGGPVCAATAATAAAVTSA